VLRERHGSTNLTQSFDAQISTVLRSVASATTELQATASSTAIAEETSNQATAVAAATEEALRGRGDASRTGRMLLESRARRVDFNKRHVVSPEIGEMLKHSLCVCLVQHGALHDGVPQH
jgi:hypothetical protein